jgi:hypothetical protein
MVAVVAVYASVVLFKLPSQVVQDSWLALVAGREIVHHGLPTSDHLAYWTMGHRWVDQQWLGQLGLYGLVVGGGITLALLVHASLVVGAFALALTAARRLGGSTRAVSWVAVACLLPIAQSGSMRTQSFAYALFVAVLWLLISDCRAPSNRVWLVVPVVVLWANLHGSVVLGAGLVMLRGVMLAFEGLAGRPRWKLRCALLLAVPVLCLFASPYGLSLFRYYDGTLDNPGFRGMVSEWQPLTLSLIHIPVYVVALAGIWLIGRDRRLLTHFERLACLFTLIAAFLAVRNTVWFGLTALIVLPRPLDGLLPSRPIATKARLNATVGLLAVAAALLALAAALHRDRLERHFPEAGARSVAAAAAEDPSARIIASARYADWLLWKVPRLRGRVAYDVRFELLSHVQLVRAFNWGSEVGEHWRAAGRDDRIVVLDLTLERATEHAVLKERGARLLFRDKQLAVLLRPTAPGRP